MTKILLVEDDSNLREIYGARLEAEGYQIVSAGDGEEALATALREKPDLIISDVMMPKISGFDMLDILRTTPETKDVKVIVMTALSQQEDRERGEQLGADKYVVKSQVTLDDLVVMVQELLQNSGGPPAPLVADNSVVAPQATTSQNPIVDDSQSQQADPQDTTDLKQEVANFVQSSPLMNGTAPTPQQPATQSPKDNFHDEEDQQATA